MGFFNVVPTCSGFVYLFMQITAISRRLAGFFFVIGRLIGFIVCELSGSCLLLSMFVALRTMLFRQVTMPVTLVAVVCVKLILFDGKGSLRLIAFFSLWLIVCGMLVADG